MEKQEIKALIDSLGITYKAKFVPFSQSRNAKEKHLSLNWLVAVERGNQSITTDFMQGIGHLKGYCYSSANKLVEHNNIKYAVESGKWDESHDKAGFRTKDQTFWKNIPAPDIVDVLYSLVMDSDVIDYATFEDWANNSGYDADSRNAEKIYRACIEIALKMRVMFGDSGMQQLREAFQDY